MVTIERPSPVVLPEVPDTITEPEPGPAEPAPDSPQAEIRQFALGPALFSCMQTGLRKLGVDASISNPDF